jgi:DNA-binding HxlR family transcriptional regulator
MARHRRETRSHCPINFALELFGDPWALLVVRDVLLYRKTRFKELLESEERMATNILSDRLARLVEGGVLERRGRPVEYTLTEKGLDLVPMLLEMSAWGAKHDPQTAAPPEFLDSYERDRQAVWAEVRSAAERGLPAFPGSASKRS